MSLCQRKFNLMSVLSKCKFVLPYNVLFSGFKSAINRKMYFVIPLKPTSRCERISLLWEDLIPFSLYKLKFSLVFVHLIFLPLLILWHEKTIFTIKPSWEKRFCLKKSCVGKKREGGGGDLPHCLSCMLLFKTNKVYPSQNNN